MSGSHSFAKREPKRTFLALYENRDGSMAKHRTTLAMYAELKRVGGLPPVWAYEAEGEAGVIPTMEEWSAIHGDDGCPTPCAKCDVAGYDPVTGRTKGGAQ